MTRHHPYTFDVVRHGHDPRRERHVGAVLAHVLGRDGARACSTCTSPGSPRAACGRGCRTTPAELVTTTVSVPLVAVQHGLIFSPAPARCSMHGRCSRATPSSAASQGARGARRRGSARSATSATGGRHDGAPSPARRESMPTTSMVLLDVRAWFHTESAYLRIWPDGRLAAQARVHVGDGRVRGRARTRCSCRLPASRRLRITATEPGVAARVTLLGVVGTRRRPARDDPVLADRATTGSRRAPSRVGRHDAPAWSRSRRRPDSRDRGERGAPRRSRVTALRGAGPAVGLAGRHATGRSAPVAVIGGAPARRWRPRWSMLGQPGVMLGPAAARPT